MAEARCYCIPFPIHLSGLSAAGGVRTIKGRRHSPHLSHHPDASVSRVDAAQLKLDEVDNFWWRESAGKSR